MSNKVFTNRSNLAIMLMSASLSRAISAVATLEIADYLKEGSLDVRELSRISGANPLFLCRIMELLSSFGVFSKLESKKFVNNELSEFLTESHPNSLKFMAVWLGSSEVWGAIGKLTDCIKTGKSGFKLHNGKELYEFLKDDNKLRMLFHNTLGKKTSILSKTIAESFAFNRFDKIIDVGGGNGELLMNILSSQQNADCALFELQDVIEKEAKPKFKQGGFEGKCVFISGSFFESIPSGYNLYILMNILHNWSDESCIKILKHCREGMKGTSDRILVVESIIDNSRLNNPNLMRDIQMMIMTPGGRERTLSDIEYLLNSCGLAVEMIMDTVIGYSIIEIRAENV